MQQQDKRTTIRIDSDIPVIVQTQENGNELTKLIDISNTGLALIVPHEFVVGQLANLYIKMLDQVFATHAMIVWCRPHAVAYFAGLKFLETSENNNKLVNQICDIEQYRREMRSFGQQLSSEQAQQAWIEKHAAYRPVSDDIIKFR